MSHASRARTLKQLITLALATALACSSGDESPKRDSGGKAGRGSASEHDSGSDMFGNAEMPGDGGASRHDGGGELPLSSLLMLVPDKPTLELDLGKKLATLQFEVTTRDGTALDAKFRVEDGSFGSIDEHGVFTPSGKRGGTTFIEARVGATVLRTELTIDITWEQSGAPADPNAGMSSGGYAGVGGEGPGGAPSKGVRTALDAKPKADTALKWLYPYDGTVFPLGLLAPLLMWSEGTAAVADGVALHVSGDHFDYHGYFGRPPALADGAAFVRHPIPQDVWEAATQTVAGSSVLTIELTLAKDGKAYGPIKRQFKIANGRLKGTVYYQSYGTNLAKNLGGAIGGDGMFGGATLAIKPGATGPELVAGATGDMGKCRVCHSVSSDGSRMTVEHGDDYDVTSSYDLRNGYKEMGYPDADRSQLAWIGMTPDGKIGLANGEPLAVHGDPISQLYDMDTGDVIASSGLSDFVREAAFPAFAHDGKMVAFNFFNGPGDATIGTGDGKKLVAMDFDPMTRAFGNPQLLYAGDLAAGWPSFSPTGNSVVFEIEINRGSENNFFYTRYGGRGELWWTNLKTGKAHRLETANGGSYLPTSADNHDNDKQLNYEPTVAPIASGGYAWMVFTSRRLYGNVATIDPWFSDPREHDLTTTPTTKKLWVAAIDLDVTTPEFNVTVGDDPSHPAFYLPGQELLAGNTRGFWVVDPCKEDGKGCESGVECCSGYCQAEEDSAELTCGKKTSDCAQEFDRCETRADCCDPKAACINHVCTMLSVD
jgi:hypothetical protein